LDCRNRLSVISVCGRRRSHNEGGKSSAVPAKMPKKWALKFRMVTSAAFQRWHPGGTSSIAILYSSLIIVFIASDTSLSRMCFFGTIPACCKCVINTRYTLASSWSFLLLMGSTKIALLSISTNDHYVFVALLGLRGKMACLVGEYCFAYVIYSSEYISHYIAREL